MSLSFWLRAREMTQTTQKTPDMGCRLAALTMVVAIVMDKAQRLPSFFLVTYNYKLWCIFNQIRFDFNSNILPLTT